MYIRVSSLKLVKHCLAVSMWTVFVTFMLMTRGYLDAHAFHCVCIVGCFEPWDMFFTKYVLFVLLFLFFLAVPPSVPTSAALLRLGSSLRPCINPFTVPASQISRLKSACACLQTVYFPVLKHIYFQRRAFWWRSFYVLMRKRKRLKHFESRASVSRSQATLWQWRGYGVFFALI